jgi:RNA polymerase sigma factor (sigma-70 family)
MDRHRLRRRWEGFLARQTPGRLDSVDRRDELLTIWSEVDRLPARQRQVLYLRYRADLTFEDIASILGIDASSARGNASRGMATLRDRLSAEDG